MDRGPSPMIFYLFQQPFLFLAWVIALLFALSVHEFSHALVGTWLGDTTAKRLGRLTLNPAAHIDPVGLIAVVLIGFGWGKPVPYNPYNLTWPRWGPTAIAAAGPVSNLLLAILLASALAFFGPLLGPANLLTTFLVIGVQLNIALLVFNLIPLPPLDGSKALLSALSHPKYAAIRNTIELQGPTILFMLIILDTVARLGIFSTLFSLGLRLVSLFVPGGV